jgi:hypothetical protein
MADNKAKMTVEADVMSPAQLLEACKSLVSDDFPVQVSMGSGEPVHLSDERDARMFGFGVHFGSMAHHNMIYDGS